MGAHVWQRSAGGGEGQPADGSSRAACRPGRLPTSACPSLHLCLSLTLSCAGRRASKLSSLIASCFTGSYVRLWGEHLGPETPLAATPMFDARAVLYPTEAALRDYLSWRQADTHVNNLVRPVRCMVSVWLRGLRWRYCSAEATWEQA